MSETLVFDEINAVAAGFSSAVWITHSDTSFHSSGFLKLHTFPVPVLTVTPAPFTASVVPAGMVNRVCSTDFLFDFFEILKIVFWSCLMIYLEVDGFS